MMSATASVPEQPFPIPKPPSMFPSAPDAAAYLWSCDEYHRLVREGYFGDARVELLDGEILRMAAQLAPHAVTVGLVRRVLEATFGAGFDVRVQAPVTLDGHSEPEPDVLVAHGDPLDYLGHHPGPSEIVLLIEVSDSTLQKDRGRKARAYARAGVADYWIVNLVDSQLEVYRDPQPDGCYQDTQTYTPQDTQTYTPDETVSLLVLHDAEIRVSALLPSPPRQASSQ